MLPGPGDHLLGSLRSVPCVLSRRSSYTFGLTQLRDAVGLFISQISRHQKSTLGKHFLPRSERHFMG